MIEAVAAGLTYWPVPLHSALDEDGDALLGVEGSGFENAETRAELWPLLDGLPRRNAPSCT